MRYLFSFWSRPWVKQILRCGYLSAVIVGSFYFCHWSFSYDVGPPIVLGPKPVIEVPAPLTCEEELQMAQEIFEADLTPASWDAWAKVDRRCKGLK